MTESIRELREDFLRHLHHVEQSENDVPEEKRPNMELSRKCSSLGLLLIRRAEEAGADLDEQHDLSDDE